MRHLRVSAIERGDGLHGMPRVYDAIQQQPHPLRLRCRSDARLHRCNVRAMLLRNVQGDGGRFTMLAVSALEHHHHHWRSERVRPVHWGGGARPRRVPGVRSWLLPIGPIGGDVPAVRSRQLFAAGGRHGVYGLRIGVLCGYGGRHRLCAVPAE